MNGDREPCRDRALHLILRPDPRALVACRSFCRAGDAVVLMDTGVLVLCEPGWVRHFPAEVEFGCLGADARGQGVSAEMASQGVRELDDRDLVRLVMDCRHCLSWK